MNQKIPRENKLKKKEDINLLFEKGKWKSTNFLRIIYLRSDELASSKIGVSVSKRYFKKAVFRNRTKRLLREVYRLNKEVFYEAFGTNNYAMLFWVSANFPKNYKEVETEFLKLCNSQLKKIYNKDNE